MPKNTNQKNNKGKKTTKPIAQNKFQPRNKETKVEPKVVEVKKVEKEKKGKDRSILKEITSNTPFVITLCTVIILIAALIFALSSKRVPKTAKGNEIIATIKGKTITANDLYEELKAENGTDALMNIIDTYIANKEVKVTDDDKKYVEEVVNYYKDYAEYYGVDLATFLSSYVGLSGISTEKEFSEYVLKDYKKTLAVTHFIGDNAKEEDLKAYYKENYTDKLTVKHILIEVDKDAEDKDAADKEAKKKAEKLIEKLNDTDSKKLDAKFEELAEENSDDTETYSKGGLIEEFAKGDVVEEFWEASNKLKDGEYTKKPVKTTYGYHIILRVSSTKAEKYKDIIDEVKKAYAQSKLAEDNTLLAKKWDELRKQYKLSIKDDIVKETYNTKLKEATKKEEKTETKDDKENTED